MADCIANISRLLGAGLAYGWARLAGTTFVDMKLSENTRSLNAPVYSSPRVAIPPMSILSVHFHLYFQYYSLMIILQKMLNAFFLYTLSL